MQAWTEFVNLDEDLQLARGLDVMREVVAEFGDDYNYRGAYAYVDGDGPSCLIAQVVHRLGLSVEALATWNQEVVDDSPNKRPGWANDLAPAVLRAFGTAQAIQDERQKGRYGGHSWGEALYGAEYPDYETESPGPEYIEIYDYDRY
jgi:hypothetical protein